jgi:hypothetical protein
VLAAGGFESNREWLREAWGQNERGEWPADNFIIRGTAFNQGAAQAHAGRAAGRRPGRPTRRHVVAIDARAPLYDGGICTRIDCVSLGVVVNRDAQRFYDEGEDFWPKRYAIWGRLVAQQPGQIAYSIIDSKAIGRFMPPVFPGVKADSLPELAQKLGLDVDTSCHARRLQQQLQGRPFRPYRAGRLPHRRPGSGQDALGAPARHRPLLRLCAAPRRDLHLSGPEGGRHRRARFGDQPSQNLFVAGEMMAGNVLGKGYTAGVGMSIGTAFGRIAGRNAALAAAGQPAVHGERRGLSRGHAILRPGPGSPPAGDRQGHPIRRRRRRSGARDADLQCLPLLRRFLRVFPAMTRRLEFAKADVNFLANLCHNCGACLHACQYAPPHEFGINIPKAMAEVRGQTYADYAWPPALGSCTNATA